MEYMLSKQPLSMLLLSTTILVTGYLLLTSSQTPDAVDNHLAADAVAIKPAPVEQDLHPARRLRASLSMPYFSFAQALSPRN